MIMGRRAFKRELKVRVGEEGKEGGFLVIREIKVGERGKVN